MVRFLYTLITFGVVFWSFWRIFAKMKNCESNPGMKKNLLLVLAFLAVSIFSFAQSMPSREEVLEVMERANTYFINKYPDPSKATFVRIMRPSNLWTRGVYFEGLTALAEVESFDKKFAEQRKRNIDYIIRWGDSHKWSPRGGVHTKDADNYCCCQTYIDMFMLQPEDRRDSALIIPSKKCMDHLLQSSSDRDWTWVDAIQMGLPVFAKMARVAKLGGDEDASRYLEKGWKMYSCTRNDIAEGLYNEEEGLWWRDKDFVPPYKEPNGRNCYWSRGNGWAYAALVRIMDAMLVGKGSEAPSYLEKLGETEWNMLFEDAHYEDYMKDFKDMSEALLDCRRKDGFWNVSLHDESNFGGKELTGTALFVYGMAWGIRHGALDRDRFLPVVLDSWNAMVKECVHDDGFLGFVQGTGKEPKDGQPLGYDVEPDFDDFGLGCFLLAGSEIYRLGR